MRADTPIAMHLIVTAFGKMELHGVLYVSTKFSTRVVSMCPQANDNIPLLISVTTIARGISLFDTRVEGLRIRLFAGYRATYYRYESVVHLV